MFEEQLDYNKKYKTKVNENRYLQNININNDKLYDSNKYTNNCNYLNIEDLENSYICNSSTSYISNDLSILNNSFENLAYPLEKQLESKMIEVYNEYNNNKNILPFNLNNNKSFIYNYNISKDNIFCRNIKENKINNCLKSSSNYNSNYKDNNQNPLEELVDQAYYYDERWTNNNNELNKEFLSDWILDYNQAIPLVYNNISNKVKKDNRLKQSNKVNLLRLYYTKHNKVFNQLRVHSSDYYNYSNNYKKLFNKKTPNKLYKIKLQNSIANKDNFNAKSNITKNNYKNNNNKDFNTGPVKSGYFDKNLKKNEILLKNIKSKNMKEVELKHINTKKENKEYEDNINNYGKEINNIESHFYISQLKSILNKEKINNSNIKKEYKNLIKNKKINNKISNKIEKIKNIEDCKIKDNYNLIKNKDEFNNKNNKSLLDENLNLINNLSDNNKNIKDINSSNTDNNSIINSNIRSSQDCINNKYNIQHKDNKFVLYPSEIVSSINEITNSLLDIILEQEVFELNKIEKSKDIFKQNQFYFKEIKSSKNKQLLNDIIKKEDDILNRLLNSNVEDKKTNNIISKVNIQLNACKEVKYKCNSSIILRSKLEKYKNEFKLKNQLLDKIFSLDINMLYNNASNNIINELLNEEIHIFVKNNVNNFADTLFKEEIINIK